MKNRNEKNKPKQPTLEQQEAPCSGILFRIELLRSTADDIL